MRLTTLLTTWRRARRGEHGFTTIVVMGVMAVAMLLATATLNNLDGDNSAVRQDREYKQAYAAAEAGLHFYEFHLNQDPNYWLSCQNVPAVGPGDPSPVNLAWNGSGADPRVWRALIGTTAKYTIELLPAAGQAACVQGQQSSMLTPNTGAFRIRATGQFGGAKRSILATMRRAKFLDYLYFTDFETSDPLVYPTSGTTYTQSWAANNCVDYYPDRDSHCTAIQFADADVVAGPLHSNDSLLVCDAPTFGRTPADLIESSGQAPGFRRACGSGDPDVQGTWLNPAPPLTMPTTNSTLSTLATSGGFSFSGRTTILLNGLTMTVTVGNAAPVVLGVPGNGVIYVKNSSCGITGYDVTQDYTNPIGCGDVWISGNTSSSLTVASDNDIIVTGNLTVSNNAELGLIANNFVRVYHPVLNRSGSTCTNSTLAPHNVTIDAAILSLTHSFIVDNYDCGASLGTLTISGAIAQKFRGPVGTSAGTGYIKSYGYDDRFLYTNPPFFLDPIASAWRVIRQTEQVPAR